MSVYHLGEVNKIIWFWTSRALFSLSYSIFILLFYLFKFLVAIKANIYLEKKRYNMIIAVLFAVSQIFALGFACSIDFYQWVLISLSFTYHIFRYQNLYSGTSLQRTCFIADSSLERTPFPGTIYLRLWSNPYISDLSIADISLQRTPFRRTNGVCY